jgi:hypothetical protein
MANVAQSITLTGFAQVAHANGGTSEPTDTYYENVVLLLHADAPNSGLIFTDFSDSFKGINPVISSTNVAPTTNSSSGKFGGYAFLPGRTAKLVVEHATDFDFGTGDFTVEGWAYCSVNAATVPLYGGDDGTNAGGPNVFVTNANQLTGRFIGTGGTVASITGGSPPSNTWFHWAYSRIGTSFRLFLDGTQIGSTGTSSAASNPVTKITIGGANLDAFSAGLTSRHDDVRLTKGTGRYSGNFTAPTAAFPDRGSLAALSAVAAQTVAPFGQAASVYGAGFLSAAAAQTMAPFTQLALVSAPSRVVQSSTTFSIAQTGTIITTAERNLRTPGDPYYSSVAYLVHGDSSSLISGVYSHPDTSKNAFNVMGQLSPSATDGTAFGGKAIAFAGVSGSYIAQSSIVLVDDRSIATTEMRVRFDVLNDELVGTPVPGSPGDYEFDATQQQTGWFFSSGGGGGGLKLGLAGHGGSYQADWTSISAPGTSIFFAPYVLQIKGSINHGGIPYDVNEHGVLEVTTGWHNVTIERNGALISVYLDGVFDFSFSLVDSTDLFFDETFVAGADITRGFAFHPEHTNLSAIEEMRHTWGVLRYGGAFTPATYAFDDKLVGLLSGFTQTGTATHSFGSRSIVGAQTLLAFAQSATATGQYVRMVGATQQMTAFGQVATVAEPRHIGTVAQAMAPFVNAVTVTTNRTAAAAKTLTISQVATARHTPEGAAGSEALSAFGQIATAKALLALTVGQIILPFGQGAAITSTRHLVGAQQLASFLPTVVLEGGHVPTSPRGYRVRAEQRITHHPF